MIRRPPRSTLDRSSAASDVYKRQAACRIAARVDVGDRRALRALLVERDRAPLRGLQAGPVSYTHLRAHETVLDLVCRLLLEKKNHLTTSYHRSTLTYTTPLPAQVASTRQLQST